MRYVFSISFLIVFIFIAISLKSQNNISDSIPVRLGSSIQKPLYTNERKEHGSFYKWAWGKHYSDLYYKPITAKVASLNSLYGGLSVYKQIPLLHSVILDDRNQQKYLLKPLGGSSSFLESKFFRDVYRTEDFKDTYLNDFITEAYTIIHPYMFIVSESLAKSANLSSSNPDIFYIAECSGTDTIADGSLIENKLVGISQLPDVNNRKVISDEQELLDELHQNNHIQVDQQTYIRTRLFDMLIGDWNKVPENWYWIRSAEGDSVIYYPHVSDRSHAFSKVDGVLFKELLNMLGVGFISNYDKQLKNVEKINRLVYPLDIAVTQKSSQSAWLAEARKIKEQLTDNEIDRAFSKLPLEMQNKETDVLKENLKARKNDLENIARKYYIHMQNTPVITGTNGDDRFVIGHDNKKNLRIRIYDRQTDKQTFDKTYSSKNTKEIWVYSLEGNDVFEVDKTRRRIPLLLIGGKGRNDYQIEHGRNVFVYESESQKERLKSLSTAKVVIPNDTSALNYDYQQLRHTKFAITPIGIYDSDLGLNLGTSFSYTIYGFRRAPYTRRHQISYDYTNGFTYQGIFPSYDEKKSLHVVAFIGSPAYFSNFFGFGNNTDGHKDEGKKFNRVNIHKYLFTPSLYYNITKDQTFNVYSSFESYKVKNPSDKDRYINQVYNDDNSIFSRKYYIDLGATYEFNKKMNHFVSSLKFLLSTGWNVNVTDPKKNYAHINADIGINLKITDRITFATLLKGKALFSDKYEFFQAATTELRGFRDNRFIGRQSFYQYSDIRLDMGTIKNPFTPLKYGVFAGIDHGRVWYPQEDSDKWHSSYGGGVWLTLLRKFTGKFSYFGSNDGSRFSFELGMGF